MTLVVTLRDGSRYAKQVKRLPEYWKSVVANTVPYRVTVEVGIIDAVYSVES